MGILTLPRAERLALARFAAVGGAALVSCGPADYTAAYWAQRESRHQAALIRSGRLGLVFMRFDTFRYLFAAGLVRADGRGRHYELTPFGWSEAGYEDGEHIYFGPEPAA